MFLFLKYRKEANLASPAALLILNHAQPFRQAAINKQDRFIHTEPLSALVAVLHYYLFGRFFCY